MIRVKNISIISPDTPEGRMWAATLEKEIRSFRAPASVRKKTGLLRAADTEEPWMVVLCSPEARQDTEICNAIDEFIREGRRDRILTMLMSGDPGKSFPNALLHETLPDGQVIEHEPLAANVTASSPEESRKKLKIERLRILAPILGVSFDELRNRRHRRRLRILLAVSGAVVLGAAAFLVYAFNRMTTISGQNRELNAQYSLAEEARQEAVSQRNTAREKLAETVSLMIRNNTTDNEKVMLLCLEFLPGNGLDSGLPEILKGALERVCAAGYVPVTNRSAYALSHGIEEEKDPDLTIDTAEKPAQKVTLTMPDEGDRFATDSFILKCWSPEYRYAVYLGGGDPNLYTWIRFLDEPEKSYFMRDENGRLIRVLDPVCMPDGTFIAGYWEMVEHQFRYSCYRYDPFGKRFVPFREGSEARAEIGEPLPEGLISRWAAEPNVTGFFRPEGVKVILGEVEESRKVQGLRIYDPETLEETGFLEGAHGEFQDIPGTDLLVIRKDDTFLVCRKDPLEPMFETRPEHTDARYLILNRYACYADGTRVMVIHMPGDGSGYAVYDLDAGKALYEITVPGIYLQALTGDGKLLCTVNGEPMLWDVKTGEVCGSVPAEYSSPEPYGPVDETSGLRTSEAINCSIVYEYHDEAIPVPEDLEGQIALARELLNGRELTEAERKTYYLNRR